MGGDPPNHSVSLLGFGPTLQLFYCRCFWLSHDFFSPSLNPASFRLIAVLLWMSVEESIGMDDTSTEAGPPEEVEVEIPSEKNADLIMGVCCA